MKTHKKIIFVVILSLFANFVASSHVYSRMNISINNRKNVPIYHMADDSDGEDIIRMQTPRLQYLYFEKLLELVREREPDIPENYFCIVVEPKNWVQEARRNVDEYNTNICSILC